MSLSTFFEMTLSACITVWSPGPNNILLLSTASKYGFKKNLHLLIGIWTGSLTLMCLCCFFCNALEQYISGFGNIMKYLGAVYIVYLAWCTLKRLPPGDNISGKEPSFFMGLLLQLLNVKIIIYGLTMFSSYILPNTNNIPLLFAFAVYLMILGALGNLIWAFAGNILKRFYESHYKFMNIVMSLLLVWCACRIIGIL